MRFKNRGLLFNTLSNFWVLLVFITSLRSNAQDEWPWEIHIFTNIYIFGNELQKQNTLRPREQTDFNRKWPLKSILRRTMLTTIRDEYQVTWNIAQTDSRWKLFRVYNIGLSQKRLQTSDFKFYTSRHRTSDFRLKCIKFPFSKY